MSPALNMKLCWIGVNWRTVTAAVKERRALSLVWAVTMRRGAWIGTGAPITVGRCPSLAAHESESMLRTYLVCREKQANGTWEKHTVY
jgi:hypothetical protein